MRELAKAAEGFSVVEYEAIARRLIDNAEGDAMGIFCCICNINMVKINPCLAIESIRVCSPVTDFSFLFKMQDAGAIPFLLKEAISKHLNWEK